MTPSARRHGTTRGRVTPEQRALRLIDLYKLRRSVAAEIVRLELEIENEYAAIRRAKGLAEQLDATVPRKRSLCGTESGYSRHRRQLKEPACDACKLAHSMAEKMRAQRRRERAA